MNGDKKGKFKTDRNKTLSKIKSLKKRVGEFHAALKEGNTLNVKIALENIKQTLEADNKAGIKKPKKGDAGQAKEAANQFYGKWLPVVTSHLELLNTSLNGLDKMRESYNYTTKDEEEIPINFTLDKESFLAYTNSLDNNGQLARYMESLWDYASPALKNRMQAVINRDLELQGLCDIEYFVEAIIPGHPRASEISEHFRYWQEGIDKSAGNEMLRDKYCKSFDSWLADKGSDFAFSRGVTYLDEVEREKFLLTIQNNCVTKADGTPLTGDNIYVLSKDKKLYGSADGNGMHHSSFLRGAPVVCGGHIITDSSGKLKSINNSSGHYGPSAANLKRALAILAAVIDINSVTVGLHGAKNPVTVKDFLQKK